MSKIINVITRCSNRPNYFSDCYRSVSNQQQEGLVHWTTSDDDATFEYLKGYDNIKIVQVIRPRRKNKNHFPYNKYVHKVLDLVGEGWVIILDDDDLFYDSGSISVLRETMERYDYDDRMLYIWKVQLTAGTNKRVVPSDRYFGTSSLDPEEITNNCFCFNVKHKNLVNFESKLRAEVDVLSNLMSNLKPVWIDSVLTMVNNSDANGGQGNRTDKVAVKTKISFKTKNNPVNNTENQNDNDKDALELIPMDQVTRHSEESDDTKSTVVFDDGDENGQSNTAISPSHQAIPASASPAVLPASTSSIAPSTTMVPVTAPSTAPSTVPTTAPVPVPAPVPAPAPAPLVVSASALPAHPTIFSLLSDDGIPHDKMKQVIGEFQKLKIHSQDLLALIKELVDANTALSQQIDNYRKLTEKLKLQISESGNRDPVPDRTSGDRASGDRKSGDRMTGEKTGKTVQMGSVSTIVATSDNKGHKYTVVDDKSDEDNCPDQDNEYRNPVIDQAYILQQHRNDRVIEQLVAILNGQSVSCQTVELKPKVKFNGLLKSILTECISRNHKRIAVLYGNEILLSSKFYGILEKALVEINPEFHLLFMVHKFTLPQIKEWSKCDADPKDYTFLYEDMKNKSEVAIQNHWKSYGNKEYRVPKISVELSKNLVDNKWGFIINQPAMRPMLQMLESMNPKQLLLENILIEYQRKYGHSFYTLPNLIIPRQPNVQRLKKVCASNGWFHNFFEIK